MMKMVVFVRWLFLPVCMICFILWLIIYCSLNAADALSKDEENTVEVFVTSNKVHAYLHNLSIELEKQREQIAFLQSKLNEFSVMALTHHNMKVEIPLVQVVDNKAIREPKENITPYRLKSAKEILAGIPLNNEFEAISFTRFTANRLYLVEPGLGRRVIEKPIGYKKRDLTEIIEFAVKNLNNAGNSITFSSADFLEGIYRTLPGFGTHYELYFRNITKDSRSQYIKVVITRFLSEPSLVLTNDINVKHRLINIIVTLSGRIVSFKRFMDNFVKVCIHQDKYVYLTLVYFGRQGFAEVRSITADIYGKYNYNRIQLILLEEPFSRSKGLQLGAQSWKGQSDVLLFMCDIDIIFNNDFLERCRLNAESGQKVYYPIVFSLYNPKLVYASQDEQFNGLHKELVMSKETGFWRDFGYGMTCQYHQDFLQMKGFDEIISGWGMEDVYLYRKYIRSNLSVVRASDPGIFHIWHEKYCDPKLSPDQYRGCIRSKALNEASHSQLGILAFKDEIDIHQSLRNKN